MADITSTTSGNFTSGSTWVGGVAPGSGDNAIAATGHTITIDSDVTVISFRQAGTGKFTLGNGRTITGDVVCATATISNGGVVQVTSTTTAQIIGNVYGPANGSNLGAVVISGTGTLTITGDVYSTPLVTASGTSGSAAVVMSAASTLVVTGSVYAGDGGSSQGIRVNTGGCTVTVHGDLVHRVISTNGGGDCVSVLSGSASVVTINGSLRVGSLASGFGLRVTSTGNTVTIMGDVDGPILPNTQPTPSTSSTVQISANSNTLTIHGDITNKATLSPVVNVTGQLFALTVYGDCIAGAGPAVQATGSRSFDILGDLIPSNGSPALTSSSTDAYVRVRRLLCHPITGTMPVMAKVIQVVPDDFIWRVMDSSGNLVYLATEGTNFPDEEDVRTGVSYGDTQTGSFDPQETSTAASIGAQLAAALGA